MRTSKTAIVGLLALAATGLLALPADAASSRVDHTRATVVRWVDGDTVVTSKGTIRLIGVDTPEHGRCGFAASKKYAATWAPRGSKVRLGNPRSVVDKDKYGRSLRYVTRGHRDISLAQIRKGSPARYDSRDGYQWHPRERLYRRTDAAHASPCPVNAPAPAPAPQPLVGPAPGSGARAPISINSCPSDAPIKGNRGSSGWIYHLPGQGSYSVTNPEECFSSASDAVAAGYRAARN